MVQEMFPKKLYQHRPQTAKFYFVVINVEKKCPPNDSTLQWHPALAGCPPPPKLVVTLPTTMAPCNGTQQWHHVHSPKVGHPPLCSYNGTLQWHHQSWPSPSPSPHPAMAPRPLPQSWSSPSPTTADYNGTLRWHPAMAPRRLHPAMAPWCHVQSAKVVRRPHPLMEVRTPIAIAIWGKRSLVENTEQLWGANSRR